MEYELDEERVKKAYDSLVKYLAISPRSEKECKTKLYGKGYHKNEVEAAISKAKKYRYIDDANYVKSYLTFNAKKYGMKKVAYKLINEKGIDRQLVDELVFIDDEEERKKCKDFALSYIRQKHIEDRSGAQKVSAYLYQKGFDFKYINAVIADIFDVYED